MSQCCQFFEPDLKPYEKNYQEIVIYSKSTCPYCIRAKAYFNKRSLKFKEIDLNQRKDAYSMLSKLMEKVTVPQIFIGKEHIGGYSDLIKLSESELRAILYPKKQEANE